MLVILGQATLAFHYRKKCMEDVLTRRSLTEFDILFDQATVGQWVTRTVPLLFLTSIFIASASINCCVRLCNIWCEVAI